MSIPCKMRPMGGGLPAGYKRVEYLEGTGTQYIDTRVKFKAGWLLNVNFLT